MNRPLEAADVDEAAAVLGAAFADDPIMGDLVGWRLTTGARAARLTRLFRRFLRVEAAREHHLTTVRIDGGHIAGVALWHEVDRWRIEPADLARSAVDVALTFRLRLPRALRVLRSVEAVHPTEPHRYLEFLGVHPSYQGRGHGGRLLAAMTEELDERGLPAYLESSDPRNEALYVRHGFASSGPIATVPDGPEPSAMWRRPR